MDKSEIEQKYYTVLDLYFEVINARDYDISLHSNICKIHEIADEMPLLHINIIRSFAKIAEKRLEELNEFATYMNNMINDAIVNFYSSSENHSQKKLLS